MSKERPRQFVDTTQCKPGPPRVLVAEADLALAAQVNVPVLISGPPAESQEVAYELDRRIGPPKGAVRVVDCRLPGAIRELLLLGEPKLTRAEPAPPKIVLLQEIHALSPDDQLRLASQFDEVRPPASTIRIVASSSVHLFDRVAEQVFDEYLYYRLNIIHIVVSPGTRAAAR